MEFGSSAKKLSIKESSESQIDTERKDISHKTPQKEPSERFTSQVLDSDNNLMSANRLVDNTSDQKNK